LPLALSEEVLSSIGIQANPCVLPDLTYAIEAADVLGTLSAHEWELVDVNYYGEKGYLINMSCKKCRVKTLSIISKP
jgi:hypothetical protein